MRPHRRQPIRLSRPWDSPGKNTGVGCHFLLQCMKVKSESEVAQSCSTLCDPMDCSLPGFSIHGILQARVLELGAIAFFLDDSNMQQNGEPLIYFMVWPWPWPLCTGWSLLWAELYPIQLHAEISLVVQWQRICLPMQGTLVWSLVLEDSTLHWATKPVDHNYWSPHTLETMLCNKRSHCNEKPVYNH